MAHQVNVEKIARRVHGELSAGAPQGVSFDFNDIIKIITSILAMFGGCALGPARSERRARNVADRSGLGNRLDRRRLRRTIEDNLSDDSQSDDVEAALLDAIERTTSLEFEAAYVEVNP